MASTTIKRGQRVWHPGFPGEHRIYMPARPEGWWGTVRKVLKDGRVAVDFDRNWARVVDPADLRTSD